MKNLLSRAVFTCFLFIFFNLFSTKSWSICAPKDSISLDSILVQISNNQLWKIDLAEAMVEFARFEERASNCPYLVVKLKIQRANALSYNDKVFELYSELVSIDGFWKNQKVNYDSEEIDWYLNYTWGRYYVVTGNFFAANLKYQKAFEVLDLLSEKGDHNLDAARPITLRQLGIVYRKMGRYEEAVSFLEQSFKLEQRSTSKALVKKNIGKSYFLLDEYEVAEKYYDEAKAILIDQLSKGSTGKRAGRNRNKIISLLNDYAVLNMELGKINKSVNYYQKAEKLLYESLSWHEDTTHYAELQLTFQYLADLMAATKKPTTAEYYYQKAKKITNSNFEKSKILIQLSKIYKEENNLNKALDTLQLAINYLDDNMAHESAELNSSRQIPNPLLLEALTLNARYSFALYASERNVAQLFSAWETVNNAASGVDNILLFYSAFEDKEKLIANTYSLFEIAISVGKELYHKTGEQKYIDQAFLFAEQSKAVVLKDAFADTYAQQMGIPETFQQKDLAYKRLLFKLDNKLKKLKYKNENSGEKYTDLLDNYLSTKKQYESFTKDTLSAFPKYQELVNETTNRKERLKSLRKNMSWDHSLVEYFIGNNKAFAFVVKKGSAIEVVDLSLDVKELEAAAKAFHHCNKSYNDESCFMDWPEKSHQLYQLVFKPIANKLTEKVTVIPDGILCYIPFSTLLSNYKKPAKIEKTPFATLSYLLHEHVFNYNYSAFTAFDDLPAKSATPAFAFSGFAPSFYENNKIAAQTLSGPDAEFGAIEGSSNLIQKISNYYEKSNNRLFKNEAGTKYNFLKYAPQSKVIHLHTHGSFDQNEPNQSYIAFHQKENSVDSNLYIRELYGLQLNANVITTAVCYSGDGVTQKGQGIISLARGFFYAGVKSVYPSLWEGNNKSLSEITNYFYENMDAGMSGERAMNKAKKDYLKAHEKEELAYPYYWGAYVGISKLPVRSDSFFSANFKLIMGFGIAFILGFLFFLRYKPSNKAVASS